MRAADQQSHDPVAFRVDLGVIAVSLELSRSTRLVTSLSPGGGEKMSKHSLSGGDIAGLLQWFSQLQDKAERRTGRRVPIVVVQEAGLDGFWIYRLLRSEDIASHVVDAALIATSRRRRRAKTDRIDGEALVRALPAYKRGEPRACAMVQVPTPDCASMPRARSWRASRPGRCLRIADGFRTRPLLLPACPTMSGKEDSQRAG